MTGIGIQIAGFIRLDSASMYHLNIIVNLAQLSTSTHLLTLYALREYFFTLQHSLARNARFGLMIVNIVALFSLSVRTTFVRESSLYQRCAQFIEIEVPSYNTESIVLFVFSVLGTGYAITSMSIPREKWYHPVKQDTLSSRIYGALFLPGITAFSLAIFALKIRFSQAMYRGVLSSNPKIRLEGTEKEWTYGQIFPILLLLLPLLNACANYSGTLFASL